MIALLPLPYKILAAFVMLGALMFGSYQMGASAESNARDAKELKLVKAAKEKYAQKEVDYSTLSTELEEVKYERDHNHKTITEHVNTYIDRPIYRTDCIDDSGLSDANAALTGKAADTSKYDTAVPAAHPARR